MLTAQRLLQGSRVAAVVGPHVAAVQVAAQDLGIPYLVSGYLSDETNYLESAYYFMIPKTSIIHDAVSSIVDAYRWSNLAVLYDRAEGRYRQDYNIYFREWLTCLTRSQSRGFEPHSIIPNYKPLPLFSMTMEYQYLFTMFKHVWKARI